MCQQVIDILTFFFPYGKFEQDLSSEGVQF